MKNKAIWEEQKRQIEDKRLINGNVRTLEKEYFHKVGANSSDVYYINEDKKKAYQ